MSFLRYSSAVAMAVLVIGGALLLSGAATKINWASQIQNFPAGCGAGQFVSAIAAAPTCSPSVAILSNPGVTQMSGGDVALASATITTILSKTVTMPSAGCPCRALIQYQLYWTSNNVTFDSWVRDANTSANIFAQAQTTGVGTNTGGIGATQMTQFTYANNAVVTFYLDVVASGSGATIKQTALENPATGTPESSWLSISVFGSN